MKSFSRCWGEGDRTRLDAIINHLLSVQMMHQQFVAADLPKLGRDRARELGWRAEPVLVSV